MTNQFDGCVVLIRRRSGATLLAAHERAGIDDLEALALGVALRAAAGLGADGGKVASGASGVVEPGAE